MIFLDANFFLRALTESTLPKVQRMSEIAGELLRQADRGAVAVTTSEAVIAEVAFVLTAKAHYQLPVAEAAGRLGAVLQLRGVKLSNKRIVLDALEVWTDHPHLGFVDALAASYGRQAGMELATFDSDFDHVLGIRRWDPTQ